MAAFHVNVSALVAKVMTRPVGALGMKIGLMGGEVVVVRVPFALFAVTVA